MSFLSDQLKELPFYLARPSPCPYLEGQVEQKVFTRLTGHSDDDFLLQSKLIPFGFRRSQTVLYRPACPTCMACVPVRIDLKKFTPSSNLKRIAKRNRDLTVRIVPTQETENLFGLFTRYQQGRHQGGDMALMGMDDFVAMMQEGSENAAMLTLRNDADETIGAMLMDTLSYGTSAVYSFFEPSEDKRSLGTELILRLIHQTKMLGLDYVYLGYWIKNCSKMAYKSRFPALERLTHNGWESFIAE